MANGPQLNPLDINRAESTNPQPLTSAALSALSTTAAVSETNPTLQRSAQGRVLNLSQLRARLSQIRPAKKSSGTSSFSSVPVVVRSNYTYGSRRPLNTIAARRSMEPLPSLPPVAEFAFSHVLLAVESDIQ